MIKNIITSSIFLFYTLLIASETVPNWFFSITSEKGIVIGCGEGKTVAEANANARSFIAASIKTRISSEYSKNENLKGADYTKEISSHISEKVDVDLVGLEQLKQEKIGDTYYVALRFDARSISTKVGSINNILLGVKILDTTSPYRHVEFVKKMSDIYPNIDYVPNYEVEWLNGRYILRINKTEISLSSADIHNFLCTRKDDKIALSLLKDSPKGYINTKRIKEGEYFHLDVKAEVPGYLSLLAIDAEGKVSVMLENEKVSNSIEITYPNLNDYGGLQTALPKNSESSSDNYIAVVCEFKSNFTKFEAISFSVNSDEKVARFPELYRDIKACNYTAIVVRTSK